MKIRENVLLKNYTTFKIGGNARYFFEVQSDEDVAEAVRFAKSQSLPFFILGGGSNTLFVSPSFDGVVIRINIKGSEFKDNGESVLIRVGAGENWDEFVESAVEKNFFGIENLSAIPGSVGAAPIQNIGAYGIEVGNVIESVEVFDTEKEALLIFSNEECRFSYRDSFFKTKEGGRFVVTRVNFILEKKATPNLSYKDVADYFSSGDLEPTLKNVRNSVLEIRRRKFPDLKKIGTAGSFFKNPIIDKHKYLALRARFGDMPGTSVSADLTKVSAAWLIDRVGNFKGVRYGDVGVWENQALVLVNFGGATGKEVFSLAEMMRKKIKDETEIELELEVVVV